MIQQSGEQGTPIRIATRASRLAMWQADYTAQLLRRHSPGCEVELVQISTTGDLDRMTSLNSFGGVGVFTREIQNALLDGRADLAVHSLKDLPTEPHDALALAAIPRRGSIFDALVLPKTAQPAAGLDALPDAARVGTGSLRRRAQLLFHRADLQPCEVRGNVETRLRKLDEGEYDALILATAGLQRLELESRISVEIRPPLMYPAVGQGALGIECRADDTELRTVLEKLDDPATRSAVTAERRLLACLRAGCHAPVGVTTSMQTEQLQLEAVVLSSDGRQRLTASAARNADEAETLGEQVADDLLAQGAAALINPDRPVAE
jgi:hydroxymethylbilane synthase